MLFMMERIFKKGKRITFFSDIAQKYKTEKINLPLEMKTGQVAFQKSIA